MKEWKLSQFDLFCLGLTIKGAWIYQQMPEVKTLNEALINLAKTYPHLTGRYNEQTKSIHYDDNPTVFPTVTKIHKDGISVSDVLGNIDKTWSLVPAFDIKGFKEGKTIPFSATLVTLKDGALLFIQCAHAVMDGFSFYTLAQQWASLCKGEPIEKMTVDQSQAPKNDAFTKEETLSMVQQENWIKIGGKKLIKLIFGNILMKSNHNIFIREVSQEEISRLRNESGAGTHAVLSAIASKEIMQKLGKKDPFNLVVVTDYRKRVPCINENFMGNLSQPFVTKTCFDPSQDTATLAKSIHEVTREILKDNDKLFKNLTLAACSAGYSLPYTILDPTMMFSSTPDGVYINNQLKFKACELDFGKGYPMYAYPNDLTDTVKFWQPVAGGPVQIIYWGNVAKQLKK